MHWNDMWSLIQGYATHIEQIILGSQTKLGIITILIYSGHLGALLPPISKVFFWFMN